MKKRLIAKIVLMTFMVSFMCVPMASATHCQVGELSCNNPKTFNLKAFQRESGWGMCKYLWELCEDRPLQ